MAGPPVLTVTLPSDVLDVVDGPDVEPLDDPLPVRTVDIAGPRKVVGKRTPGTVGLDAPDVRTYCSTLDSSTARKHTPTFSKGQQQMMDSTITRRIGYRKANEEFNGQTSL